MFGLPVKIYAQAPASAEERTEAINAYRRSAKDALLTGVSDVFPTSTEAWIKHIDRFTLGCRANNELALADRRIVGPLEDKLGDHWRFGFELIRAGMEVAMEHQQAKVKASNASGAETRTYQRLLTSFQVARTTFNAFGNPARRPPSIH